MQRVGEQGWRAGQGPDLAFAYGASGQRISKQVGGTVGDPGTYREHYIRDAQGNVMATYRLHPNGAFRVQERPIYGSSRVGLYAGKVDLYPATQLVLMPQVIPVFDALLRYELTDHLGNVGTVITGRLLPGDGAPHEAEVISAQGYEPFGSLMPGRNYSSSSYNYGFNGKPKDDEIHGATGTSYDFGARMFDPRVSRFLSIDPKAAEYPWMTPYCFAANNPIAYVDYNGEGPEHPIKVGAIRKVIDDGKAATGYRFGVYFDQPQRGHGNYAEVDLSRGEVGHCFISLSKINADGTAVTVVFGFYPENTALPLPGMRSDPGQFGDDGGHAYDFAAAIDITEAQFCEILDLADAYENSRYDITNRNCSDFTMDACGIANLKSNNSNRDYYIRGVPDSKGKTPAGCGNNFRISGKDLSERYRSRNITMHIPSINDDKEYYAPSSAPIEEDQD